MFDSMLSYLGLGAMVALGAIAVVHRKEVMQIRAMHRASVLEAMPLHDHEADQAHGWVHAHFLPASGEDSGYEPGISQVMYFKVNQPELLIDVDQHILKKLVKDLRSYNLKVCDITIYDAKGYTEVQYNVLSGFTVA